MPPALFDEDGYIYGLIMLILFIATIDFSPSMPTSENTSCHGQCKFFVLVIDVTHAAGVNHVEDLMN